VLPEWNRRELIATRGPNVSIRPLPELRNKS